MPHSIPFLTKEIIYFFDQIATPKDDQGKTHPIPVIASKITINDSSSGESPTLQLVRGSHARPVFENFELENLSKSECLVRSQDGGSVEKNNTASGDGCKYVVSSGTKRPFLK